MSWDEHIMLIAHTVNVYGDRLKVCSGVTCGMGPLATQHLNMCNQPQQRPVHQWQ